MTGLLKQAKDYFKARGTPIGPSYRDGRGEYAFAVRIEGVEGYKSSFVVTAKKYLSTRDDVRIASFMRQKVAARAADMDARLLQFVARGNEHLVFDPDAVLEYGLEPDDQSRRRKKGEDWADIPAAWGCSLEDFVERRDALRVDPAENDILLELRGTDTGNPTLEDY